MKLSPLVLLLIFASCSSITEKQRNIASEDYLVTHKTIKEISYTPSSMDFPADQGVIDNVANGFSQIFSNLNASPNSHLVLTRSSQPISNEILKSLKIKRVFLYIDQVKKSHSASNHLFGDNTFKFLERFSIKVSGEKISDQNDYRLSNVQSVSMSREQKQELIEMVKESSSSPEVVLKYDGKHKEAYTRKESVIYLIKTSDSLKAKKYLTSKMNEVLKQTVVLDNHLIVELKNDVVAEEIFHSRFTSNPEELDLLNVSAVEACREDNCLDLNPEDVSLMPMLNENGITIEAFIQSRKVPANIKIGGFIEFESKLNVTDEEE